MFVLSAVLEAASPLFSSLLIYCVRTFRLVLLWDPEIAMPQHTLFTESENRRSHSSVVRVPVGLQPPTGRPMLFNAGSLNHLFL